ncbi:MAG: TrkA family potassium uptake protein [Chromatiaceae bacterium]|nr:MAG: TrkA family potassium uptake protein [Chromatiaceae bacterium]
MPDIHRSFVVIGLGTFGATVAMELARLGNYVLGIDLAEAPVARLADKVAHAVIADGRDEAALREAGAGKVDVGLVAIGEDLESNIVCTMNLKLVGVKTVWSKAKSHTHFRILTKVGATRVVQAEQQMGQHVAQVLHNPAMLDYVSLGNGYHVVNIAVPEKLADKTLGSLRLLDWYDLRCLGLMRGPEFIDPGAPETRLKAGDLLLLLGRRANLRSFGDSL